MSKWDRCILKESFTITATGNLIARKLNHHYYHTSFVSMYQTIILSNKPLYRETQYNRLLIYCVLASRHGPCLEQYCPNYQTCNGCGAGLSNFAMVVGLVHQTMQWLLRWPVQTAGLSNLAMVAGLAYSNSWPIKPCNGCWAGLFKQLAYSNLAMVAGLAYSNSWPIKHCNGCRAGLFKQGNGCTAGLFRQLAYQTLQWLQGWPINGCWAGLSNLAMAVGLAFSNKAKAAGLVHQTLQQL